MITAVLLGGGNLALHLYDALQKSAACRVVQVYNRSLHKIGHLGSEVQITNDPNQLATADVYLLSVSDDAISKVSECLIGVNAIVAHTSGSATLEVLPNNGRRACFYPLQTFTKGLSIDYRTVPICLEAEREEDLIILQRMAASISDSVYRISSQQRQALHLAAVFVNNFTNHLYLIGKELCAQNNLPFDLLRPLIKETAQKIERMDPLVAQTGPAKRGDQKTLARHQLQLQDKIVKEIYFLLSESIKNTYKIP